MRPSRLVLILLCAAFSGNAAGTLAIVNATIQQGQDGSTLPPGFTHVAGEVMTFSFQIEGYQVSPEQKINLDYKVDALDPQGVRIMETIASKLEADLAPQDKNWKPKVRQEIVLPPLAGSGTYKIHVLVADSLAKTSASKEVSFEVRGHEVEPSDTLAVRNFRFFRSENDETPLAKPVYRPGDTLWARFDIIGHKFGPANSMHVSYGIGVLNSSGKVLWSQPEAAVEKSQSFYPKRYLPGSMSLNLQPTIRPGDYAIAITVQDAIGNQTFETKQTFSVE